MDMGDGSSFIDEFSHSDFFGHDADEASGFDWADELLSSSEGLDKANASGLLEATAINNVQQSVQYSQATGQLSSQPSSVNVQYIQSTSNTTVQQIQQQQPTQILPNLTNLTQGGGQLIQGVNGQIFLKPLPNGQFQLATQPQLQHPQQSSSPIPIQPHPQGSPHVNIVQTPSQSPIPISSPHVGSLSSSTHVSRSITPLQQTRQYQNVSMLQVPGSASQTQPQIIRNLPITSQISNMNSFQTQQIIQSQGQMLQNQGQNPGQNFVNTQNTVIQNPNVVNVNVAHVLCPNQFQGQQGQSIQGTLIQTADGKHIIIPSSQLPGSNQIQIQNVPQMIQPQINVVPSSSATGTTPLVQGGQVVENNAAALGGLGYIRIATPSSSSQETKVPTVQQQQPTHFIGLNQQGQQILIQRAPTPGQNIVLRQVAPPNILQLPQQQTASSSQILPQSSQATQQILLPQVQRIVTGPQGQQQVKLVAPSNIQGGNLPMTLNIGGQNIILPSNFQQLIQQQQPQVNQVQKTASSIENVQNRTSSGILMASSTPSSRVVASTPVSAQQLNLSSLINCQPLTSTQNTYGQPINSQVPTFLLPQVTASTANMTPVTTTVSQTKQVVSQVSISNSPKMYQTISSVASNITSTASTQQPFLSAMSNAPKLPMTTIQLSPQAHQQISRIQTEIRMLASLKDPTEQQKKQLNTYREGLKQLIAKGQIKIQSAQQQMQTVTSIGQVPISQTFIGQPAVSVPQSSSVMHHQPMAQSTSTSVMNQNMLPGNMQSQATGAIPAQGLVTSEISFISTKSVQSQSGSIMSVSSTGSKPIQQPINTPASTPVLVPSQQGQQSVSNLLVQSGASASGMPPGSALSNVASAVKGLTPGVSGKVSNSASSQVAVPTQIKIANHILTLNLTPEQKEKVQGYLAKMPIEQQQQQMALFLKLQQQQKLNAQVQAQMEHQKRLQAGQQSTNVQSQLPLTVQPQIVSSTSTGGNLIIEQPGTSPSRPNIVHRVSVAAIPKHQLIHQQLGKDQANAVQTDTNTPFRNQRDTYRRLLRYHVFQTKSPPDHLIKKDDEMFDDLSEGLVKKKNWMFEKYRSLLLEESMREEQTAEIMMIQKMLNEDLKEVLDEEKKTIKRNPDEFDPMPRKYLRLGSQLKEDVIESKFDPNSIQIKVEKPTAASPVPSLIKKESTESTESRPSTPKLKLVIKSDGQRYSSIITEEDGAESLGGYKDTSFMRGISVKEEQIEIDDQVPFSSNMKPFDSYSPENKSRNHSNISDDLVDNGADSDSDITVVSDDENKTNDPIVIDDDEEENDNNSSGDNQEYGPHSPISSGEPVIKHEDISSDFTDFFSNKYPSGSSELSFYTKTSLPNDISSRNVNSGFPPSDPISNDKAYSQNSDAHSTQTIPYSEDGNSIKEEDFNDEFDYNKSTSSFAHYEPISSPEADQTEPSFSNYLAPFESSSFNMGGIRDQNMGFGLSKKTDSPMSDDVTESPPWMEEPAKDEFENADKIKAEMESAINSILSLN